jgi:hypothetical protein
VLALLTVAAAAGALFLTADRRRTAARLGFGMAAAGVVVLIGYAVARALALGTVGEPDDRVAAGEVWNAFLGDLRTTGWLLAGAGAVVAAAAQSLLRPVAVEAPLRAAWRMTTTEPVAPPLRLTRACALIAAGVLLITHPRLALHVLTTVLGVYVLYKGVEAILRLVYRPRPDEPAAETAPRRRPRARLAAVVAIATLLIAGTVAAFVAGGLINHWVTTAPVQRPSDAAKVNAYGPLLSRARTCQRVRAHLPSLVAVNFYKEGDVFGVVDTLNRVG